MRNIIPKTFFSFLFLFVNVCLLLKQDDDTGKVNLLKRCHISQKLLTETMSHACHICIVQDLHKFLKSWTGQLTSRLLHKMNSDHRQNNGNNIHYSFGPFECAKWKAIKDRITINIGLGSGLLMVWHFL